MVFDHMVELPVWHPAKTERETGNSGRLEAISAWQPNNLHRAAIAARRATSRAGTSAHRRSHPTITCGEAGEGG